MRRWRSSHPNHVLCLLGKMPGAGVGDSNHFPTCRLDRLERCFDADWHCTSSQHRETAGSSRQAGRMTEPWAQVAWRRGPELHHERASGDGTNDWFVHVEMHLSSVGCLFYLPLENPIPSPLARGRASQLHHRTGRPFLPAARTNARNGGEGASGRLRYSGWPWRPK